MDFTSEMNIDQYEREVGLDPNTPVPSDIKIEQDKINKAAALVFIYPVWWSDCPSILKAGLIVSGRMDMYIFIVIREVYKNRYR